MEPANLLKIKSLTEEWCDKDIVMLHACFQLLEDSIKEENLFDGHTDWEQSDEFKQARVELQELYDWWIERKELEKSSNFHDLINRENYEEDNKRLKKLIKWRHMLWT
jgi:hypothetical protein